MIANYKQAVPLGEPEPEINYIDYIQSSGSQYIDTSFIPNNNTRVVMDVQPLNGNTAPIFGCRSNSSGSASFLTWVISSTQFRDDYGSNGHTSTVNTSTTVRVFIDKNKNSCKIGSNTVTHSSSSFSVNRTALLFACRNGSDIDPRKIHARLYSCQVYDNDNLIRDYAPALDPDGVPCLYDKVSEEYVYNSGSGSFITP